MIFSRLPTGECLNAVLAHTVRLGSGTLHKGRVLTGSDLERLQAEGVDRIIAARLEPGDVGEDLAAGRIAAALAAENLEAERAYTGRCYLRARCHGLLQVNRPGIDQINQVHEAVTLATLEDYARVLPGQAVATIKIIPFSVPEAVLQSCSAAIRACTPALRIHPFRPATAGLIQTRLPGTRNEVLDKTGRVTRDRLQYLGSRLGEEIRCAHDADELTPAITRLLAAGLDLILVSGATATVDRGDVVPEAICRAGGEIVHFGMPVDPGNLLLLGRCRGMPVIGMPGCARSPATNGFDWVLERQLAGLPPGARDIMGMGVGGLLKQPPDRSSAPGPAETPGD